MGLTRRGAGLLALLGVVVLLVQLARDVSAATVMDATGLVRGGGGGGGGPALPITWGPSGLQSRVEREIAFSSTNKHNTSSVIISANAVQLDTKLAQLPKSLELTASSIRVEAKERHWLRLYGGLLPDNLFVKLVPVGAKHTGNAMTEAEVWDILSKLVAWRCTAHYRPGRWCLQSTSALGPNHDNFIAGEHYLDVQGMLALFSTGLSALKEDMDSSMTREQYARKAEALRQEVLRNATQFVRTTDLGKTVDRLDKMIQEERRQAVARGEALDSKVSGGLGRVDQAMTKARKEFEAAAARTNALDKRIDEFVLTHTVQWMEHANNASQAWRETQQVMRETVRDSVRNAEQFMKRLLRNFTESVLDPALEQTKVGLEEQRQQSKDILANLTETQRVVQGQLEGEISTAMQDVRAKSEALSSTVSKQGAVQEEMQASLQELDAWTQKADKATQKLQEESATTDAMQLLKQNTEMSLSKLTAQLTALQRKVDQQGDTVSKQAQKIVSLTDQLKDAQDEIQKLKAKTRKMQ